MITDHQSLTMISQIHQPPTKLPIPDNYPFQTLLFRLLRGLLLAWGAFHQSLLLYLIFRADIQTQAQFLAVVYSKLSGYSGSADCPYLFLRVVDYRSNQLLNTMQMILLKEFKNSKDAKKTVVGRCLSIRNCTSRKTPIALLALSASLKDTFDN